jgi:protein-disulfide isomerase/uncharacterized membrane protein
MKIDNITAVTFRLLKELDIKASKQGIVEEFRKHPYHYSLYAISDIFNYWNIPNVSFNLTIEELLTVAVPFPAIAYLSNNEFAVIHDLDENAVILSDQDHYKQSISIGQFRNMYGGSVLIAEKDELSGEPDFQKKSRKELVESLRIPLGLAGIGSIILCYIALQISFQTPLNWLIVTLFLIKTTGVIAAVILVSKSTGDHQILKRFCKTGGDATDCNQLLSSKAAKITEELSWSEVGLFYFAGTWISLLFNSNSTGILQLLAVLNLISLPYTFYSIFYQWKVAKQWCVVCSAVQVLLWLEFFAFLPFLTHPVTGLNVVNIVHLLTGLLAPVSVWILLKPFLKQGKEIELLKVSLSGFKYSSIMFETQLNNEAEYVLPAEKYSIILGNTDADTTITMVSNPFCQPCSRVHKELDAWIFKKENIKLQIVFAFNPGDTDIISHMMALQLQDGASVKQAIHDWYHSERKDYETWAKNYPLTIEYQSAEALKEQYEWCKGADISSTPALFINGRRLPNNYKAEDIKYLV